MIKKVFYKTLQIHSEPQVFMSNLLREVPIEICNQIYYSFVTNGLPIIYLDFGQPGLFIFPEKTVCDMLLSHLLLRKHLGIKYIHAVKRGTFCVFSFYLNTFKDNFYNQNNNQ